ncbi:hypothetical protein HPP92_015246 [Vanilla planifolia]|uniref:Uncharacterized protein n=1 Tax=Vanilla planifolia TaxID=51239 RepID=A0A835QSJ8_VANPL|nr:hypothetical protein HPP92_015246 [Vanilla planifolia]
MAVTGAANSNGSASACLHRFHLPPSPSPLRLSSRPIAPVPPRAPWFSIQGLLVDAGEFTSAQAVGRGLGPVEAVAWELFTPLHRVLLVALVAVASAEATRSQRISELQRSIDLRDEVLRNMQIKLDEQCEQMSFVKDQPPTSGFKFSSVNEQNTIGEMVEANGTKFCHCGCQILHLNPDSAIVPLCSNQSIKTKDVYVTELTKERLYENNHAIVFEPEERRMSDLSDFCWSVASSVDIQAVHLSTLAAEQELYNLRKECEEKDCTINELRTAAHASNASYSKRITELEEIIKRKNMIITRLKKDMVVLEQQIIKLTRLRRQSSSSSFCSSSSSSLTSSSSDSTVRPVPLMTENILYDMSSTSPSSSDCDSPNKIKYMPSCISSNQIVQQSVKNRKPFETLPDSSVSTQRRSASPLKENRVSRKLGSNAAVNVDHRKTKRGSLQEVKNMMAHNKKRI